MMLPSVAALLLRAWSGLGLGNKETAMFHFDPPVQNVSPMAIPKNRPSVSLYYMNGCPHCENFKDEYQQLPAALKAGGLEGVPVYAVDTQENATALKIANKKIFGVPLIEINTGNGAANAYRGERKASAIAQTMKAMMGGRSKRSNSPVLPNKSSGNLRVKANPSNMDIEEDLILSGGAKKTTKRPTKKGSKAKKSGSKKASKKRSLKGGKKASKKSGSKKSKRSGSKKASKKRSLKGGKKASKAKKSGSKGRKGSKKASKGRKSLRGGEMPPELMGGTQDALHVDPEHFAAMNALTGGAKKRKLSGSKKSGAKKRKLSGSKKAAFLARMKAGKMRKLQGGKSKSKASKKSGSKKSKRSGSKKASKKRSLKGGKKAKKSGSKASKKTGSKRSGSKKASKKRSLKGGKKAKKSGSKKSKASKGRKGSKKASKGRK